VKRFCLLIAVVVFAIFAITDVVHDIIVNDPVHYFAEQPHQLLVVALIAIVGGLLTLLFYRLSPHSQRRVKLFTLGLAASFVTVCGLYFVFQFARLQAFSGYTLALALLCVGVVAALLWLEFYHLCRSRVS
jgi:hypothetical protein